MCLYSIDSFFARRGCSALERAYQLKYIECSTEIWGASMVTSNLSLASLLVAKCLFAPGEPRPPPPSSPTSMYRSICASRNIFVHVESTYCFSFTVPLIKPVARCPATFTYIHSLPEIEYLGWLSVKGCCFCFFCPVYSRSPLWSWVPHRIINITCFGVIFLGRRSLMYRSKESS